jgi:hypothetical protein
MPHINNKPTTFISAGCSYSQVPAGININWPRHVQELPCFKNAVHLGHGASGNATISRKVISKVLEVLELGVKPDDIVVGVMWSGCDRLAHISPNLDQSYYKCTQIGLSTPLSEYKQCLKDGLVDFPVMYDLEHPNTPGYKNNPDFNYNQGHMNPSTLRDPKNPVHYIMNSHWKDEMTLTYFEHFGNYLKAIIETCEHILRTEWFLKSKGIKFFFTEYDNDVFRWFGPSVPGKFGSRKDYPNEELNIEGGGPDGDYYYSKQSEGLMFSDEYLWEIDQAYQFHPEINYLYNQIDKDYWLPIDNLQDWVTNKSKFEHATPGDPHPSTEQHKDFTEKVILPFLLEKYSIDQYNV